MQLAVGVLACLLAGANAFYLPGVSPHAYEAGEQVRLQVNSLTSVKTHLPYEFYNLKYCRPDVIREAPENLGQLLMGNDILNSAFQVRCGAEAECSAPAAARRAMRQAPRGTRSRMGTACA